MNKKEIVNFIVHIATELGFPKINVAIMKLQMLSRVQTLVPTLSDSEFLEQSVRYNLQVWLKYKGKDRPEDIPYQEWLEFLVCFFMKPHFGRINSFINKYHPTISINLAILVPVVSMLITVLRR